jgi:hypothetical protein
MAVSPLSLARAGTINLAEGAITVTDIVTQMGPVYQYNYTVTDLTGQLAVLDIAVAVGVPISGLSAPGGSSAFTSTIDTVGLGSSEMEYVSFLENNGIFSSTPESGFLFDSPVGPGASTFDATLFDGTTGTGAGITAPTTAPAPEPSTFPLCVLGGGILLILQRKAGAFRFGKSR